MATDIDVDDFDNLLLEGVALLITGAGIGVYRETGAYADGETAIVLQSLPATPDTAVAVSTYAISDDASSTDSVVGVQVFSRATSTGTQPEDPRPTNRLASRVFNLMHAAHDFDLPTGVHVITAERRSSALLGQDDLRRWERVDNYYLTVYRPATNRL